MPPISRKILAIPVVGRLAGLLTLALIAALLLLVPARAQTPGATTPAETTPVAGGQPVIRIELDAPAGPLKVGALIHARVVVDNVQHLAGYDFTLSYDPDKLRPILGSSDTGATPVATVDSTPSTTPAPDTTKLIKVENLGDFLKTSERGQGLYCPNPSSSEGQVTVGCSTIGLPLCLGGSAGASGSGVLGVVSFKSRGGGDTQLAITSSTLVLDDLNPCSPDTAPTSIEHQRQGASLVLGPKPHTSTLLIVVIVVVVVVVAAAGGALGYRFYRSRSG